MSILPHYSEICILRNHRVKKGNLIRSVWLGVSQALLNLPRLVLTEVVGGVVILLVGLVNGLWHIAWRGLVTPILSVLCLAALGLCGRVTLISDEETKGEEIIELGMIHGRKA